MVHAAAMRPIGIPNLVLPIQNLLPHFFCQHQKLWIVIEEAVIECVFASEHFVQLLGVGLKMVKGIGGI